jgi:prolipoprotein diacylglyceryl transferase
MFILLGVIAALFIGNKRWADRGGERGVIFDIALWAIIFGLIGGRLYHVLTDWSTYFGPGGAGLIAAFKIQEGGLGIWGAVALGGVGAWIGCRRKGIPLPAFGDAIAPGIVLAQAIGRIGNYFNQELYGRTTTLPWGLEIYERRDANGALDSLNGVSTGQLIEVVHPTFLYELLWNLVVFGLLLWVDRRFRIGHGRLFALYVAAYCFGRFWVELMRSDMATHIAGIRINSFVSVFVFIGAVVYIMVAPKGREDPSELRGYAEDGEAAAPGANLPTEKIEQNLVAAAATTGVVAAAKAAGEKEDEDATEVIASGENEPVESGGEEASEVEAVAESEQLAEDVAEAPAEEIAEAEAFAEAGEDSEPTVAIGGVGAVEGDEVVKAEEAAPEVHQAAVEDADDAASVADEAAAKADADEAEPEAEPESAVGGVGAVEGGDAVAAERAAAEVHEAAVENADDAVATDV